MTSTTYTPWYPCRSTSRRDLYTSRLLEGPHRRQRHDPRCLYPTYPTSGLHGGGKRRAAALVMAGLMAVGTATACRTDVLPTPRPLSAPTLPAEAGESAIRNLDAVRVICERGRAVAQAVRVGRSVDGVGASIQLMEQVSLDNGATDSISALVSDLAGAWRNYTRMRPAHRTADERQAVLASMGSLVRACDS